MSAPVNLMELATQVTQTANRIDLCDFGHVTGLCSWKAHTNLLAAARSIRAGELGRAAAYLRVAADSATGRGAYVRFTDIPEAEVAEVIRLHAAAVTTTGTDER